MAETLSSTMIYLSGEWNACLARRVSCFGQRRSTRRFDPFPYTVVEEGKPPKKYHSASLGLTWEIAEVEVVVFFRSKTRTRWRLVEKEELMTVTVKERSQNESRLPRDRLMRR